MKKAKSPWYGLIWISVWTVVTAWLLYSGMFTFRESIGLAAMWAVFVAVAVYGMVGRLRAASREQVRVKAQSAQAPKLNAPCPCGSGKKFKRCCGASA